MLMVPRIRGHLRHLSFRDLERKDPADTLTLGVHFEHDARRGRPIEAEELLQHVDDELHRGIVVIQQDHPVKWRLLDLRPRLLDENAGIWTGRVRVGHVFIYRGRESATQACNSGTPLLLQKQSLESATEGAV